MKTATLLSVFLSGLLITSCRHKPFPPWQTEIIQLRKWDLSEIRIRDPFILRDDVSKKYYLFAQKGNNPDREEWDTLPGVEAYASTDLETWYGPRDVFLLPEDFWADYQVWAPEVHAYRDRYYLFVTLSSHDTLPDVPPLGISLHKRGTQVLVADDPLGPFKPFTNQPHTPMDWSCLDGTLWVEDSIPYMVFCHEWTQIVNGSIEMVWLADDLSMPAGEPMTLFHAGDAEWVTALKGDGKVTDGCFLYKTEGGVLIMIWSSFGKNQYAIATALSESGKIAGPWVQSDLLFDENGGHGMIFKTFEGELLLLFHQPNQSPLERAQLYRLTEENDRLILGEKYF